MANTQNKLFYALTLGLEMGFLIALPLVLFLLAGLFLDRKLGTLPVFLISSVIFSLAAVFFELRYLVLPFLEKRSHNNK